MTMISGLVTYGCVEPFEAMTETFESALVIEATITNELKKHEVILSRTFRFEDEGSFIESNAKVKIVDGDQQEYIFQETVPGTYSSMEAFSALPSQSYKLSVTTGDGRSYSSETMKMTQPTQIDDLYAERVNSDNGIEGMAIFVDSYDPAGNSQHYRYEYDETYKIIAPKWTSKDLITLPGPVCPRVIVVRREREERVCYATDASTDIILTNTNNLDEDRVERFLVRFINRENYILSHRYSILVRQYVQSNAAFTFFETLNDFSNSESLFSETQAGFLSGNVYSEDNSEENVVGYFDVATVSEKRIFFNYSDFFPDEPLPPYVDPCKENAPKLAEGHGPQPRCVLSTLVDANLVRYWSDNPDYIGPRTDNGPFFIVPRVCGDCTVLGEIKVPEFWRDE